MTYPRFIDHEQLRQWFERAEAVIHSMDFPMLAGRFYQDVSNQIQMELSTWRHAQEQLRNPVTPALFKQDARIKQSVSSKHLQVLVPARRYILDLHRRLQAKAPIRDPLRLTYFLAGRALMTSRLGLQRPLTVEEMFDARPAVAQITPTHWGMARKLLAVHPELFGTTTQELAAIFQPLRHVPTEHDLAYESRQSRRNAVIKKIVKAGILTADELALIS